MPTSLPRLTLRTMIDGDHVGVRQLASTIGLALALLALALLPDMTVVEPWAALTGVVMIAAATVAGFVVPWQRVPRVWVIAVPLGSLLAFGFFRVGTGGAQSVFTALALLSVVWIASEPGRRMVAIAALGMGVVMLMPYLLALTHWDDGQLLRVIFTPLVFGIVAAIVNQLARRLRSQVARMQQLAEERAVAARRLRRAEAFSRSVWDSIVQQAVVVTDLDGRVVACGPGAERLFGVTFEQVEQQPIVGLLERAGSPGEPVAFSSLTALAVHDEVESGLLARVADGQSIPVDITCSPRLDETGATRGHIVVALDTTRAHEAARVKDEFVGSVSHELRTPLSSVLGYLELLREEVPLEPEHRRYLEVAERNAHRLLALVNDLLLVAQVQAGRFPLDASDLAVDELVVAAAESALPAARAKGVDLRVDASESLRVHGDALQLGQALDNLLSNAIKFTPSGGTVVLSAHASPDAAIIEVTDTGIGIPEGEMERVFTRFFRSTSSTRHAIAGIGLGLHITAAIAEAHRGSLHASSVEGAGTTMTLTLPLGAEGATERS